MTRPRSLADELAELVNPTPQAELDPEAAGIGDAAVLGASDDELEGMVAAAAGRRAIATDIAMTDGEYAGRRSNRAALFGDANGVGGHSSSSDAGDDEGSDADAAGQGGPGELQYVMVDYSDLPSGRRNLSLIPTMFANGHMNGPGPDDPTSSSSLSSEEEDESGQGDGGEQQGAGTEHQQVAAGASGALAEQQRHQQEQRQQPHQQQQQQEQEQEQEQQLELGSQQEAVGQDEAASSSEGERGEGEDGGTADETSEPEADEQDRHQQAQQQDEDHAGSSSEGEDVEGDDEDAVSDDQQQQQQQQAIPEEAAAAAGLTAISGGVIAMPGDDEEMQQLEREAAAVQAESVEAVLATGARRSRDAEKAAGVRAQQRLWGAALELRIRLQKALSGANVLPRPDAHRLLVANNQQVARGYTQLLSSCQQTLQDMLHLHHTLAQQHPAAAAALAAAPPVPQQQQEQRSRGKRSRTAAGLSAEGGTAAAQGAGHEFAGTCSSGPAAWCAVDGAISSLAGFRDAALDKWHRRTVLASGTAALRGSSGLRALQQSVSSQVAALMADKAKLISRSQLPMQLAPRPLGQPAAADAAAGAEAGDGDAGGQERMRDAETYDEGDFYQQLLKELLESAPPGSLPQELAGARPPKRRKLVDRRASKGRKLRYHVMDKLVGFMAPAELVQPPFAEQLFGNLFSHEG